MDKPDLDDPIRDNSGKFSHGNSLWKDAMARGVIGRKRTFDTPELMMEAAASYFEWCDNNPLFEQKVFHSQGIITKTEVEHKRPYTISGFCAHSGLSDSGWYDYKNRTEFSAYCEIILKHMYEQKFNGAAIGIFNANLIARDLGIREVSDVKQEVSGTTTVNSNVTIKGDDITDYLKSKHSKE